MNSLFRKIAALVLGPFLSLSALSAADTPRERILINNDWKFSLGHAGDISKDFSYGTEYFTYQTKILSSNGKNSPVSQGFDDSGWRTVSLPHDWVVDLPYSEEASHSNGYKCVGWKYPEYSVGWYRKNFFIPESDKGRRILIEFEGIYRDSEVFCNGIYLGHERSGYASSVYDLTEYLDYGSENLITVRADASLEEGGFYEGAGIYRNVYLHKTSATSIEPYGVVLKEYRFNSDRSQCTIVSEVKIDPLSKEKEILVVQSLLDADGRSVALAYADPQSSAVSLDVRSPELWSIDSPYLYTLRTCLYKGDMGIENLLDVVDTRIGIRSIDFDSDRGFLLNGYKVELKGCDLHTDHAGVGTAVPDGLWRYRLQQLKKYGFNTIRSSHNPASPAMLDLCDEMGFVVIDENCMMGINDEHFDLMERMIRRDVNHPSVILWSIGNEEWSSEHNPKEYGIANRMCNFVRSMDSTRPVICGDSGVGDTAGFDYRGVTDSMSWPATGSQSGVLNYCGFPKDEAFYLQSCWTAAPMVYVSSNWSRASHEGESVDLWIYSNCDEVRLLLNGIPVGKKSMPEDGRLSWPVNYKKGKLEAQGYVRGKKITSYVMTTPDYPYSLEITPSKHDLVNNGQDIVVLDISVLDTKGRFVPNADVVLNVTVSSNVTILGWGNGDPAFKVMERPENGNGAVFPIQTFSGKAQLILRSVEGASGNVDVSISGLNPETCHLHY